MSQMIGTAEGPKGHDGRGTRGNVEPDAEERLGASELLTSEAESQSWPGDLVRMYNLRSPAMNP